MQHINLYPFFSLQFQPDGYNTRDNYRGRDNFGTLRSHQVSKEKKYFKFIQENKLSFCSKGLTKCFKLYGCI
jgi:hypothetical protein